MDVKINNIESKSNVVMVKKVVGVGGLGSEDH
jgi:hypothetical protein